MSTAVSFLLVSSIITKETMDSAHCSVKLPDPLTFTYKLLPYTSLHADVYFPMNEASKPPSPIILFIHGGAWISGSRKEISPAYFYEFLQRNFVVVSIDYRLLPESDFVTGQLEDIRDVESWLRSTLPEIMLAEYQRRINGDKIVILGVSAGAHLALLTASTRFD